jgi:predicted O-methyltransferase YrrM
MLKDLKQYAKDHVIPIICDDGLLFLKDVIKDYHIKDVLEIGTAIGYSAIFMAEQGCNVLTFERNDEMVKQATNNIKPYSNQIKVIHQDALLYDQELNLFDMIFIDAAKAQYQKFFNKFVPYLKKGGIVVCDNLNFHHLNPSLVNRNTRQLIRKINEFKVFLEQHQDYKTTFFDIGDGMSITMKVCD